MPKRILILAGDSGIGQAGMRVQAFELGSRVASLLVAQGHAVTVALRLDDVPFADAVAAAGARVLPLPVGRNALDRLYQLYRRIGQAAGQSDIIYSLNPKLPYAATGNRRTALTIHDQCYLDFPQEFDRLRRTYHWLNQRYLLPRVDHIFTVSSDTATRLRKHFGHLNLPPITVAPNGTNTALATMDAPDPRGDFSLQSPYFLFLGKLSPRKNLAVVIRAVSRLAQRDVRPHIVMVGPKGWRESENLDQIRAAGIEDCFKTIGFVEAPMLAGLMRHASGLLYPSVCEGFGMPVLEGLAHGIPVVVARGTACCEIGGPFVTPIEPNDDLALAQIMESLLEKPVGTGPLPGVSAFLKRYDWARSAEIVATTLGNL